MATATANGRSKTNGRMDTRRIVTHSQTYDANVSRLIDAPSPAKMAAILDRIDRGEIGLLCQLQAEMERKSDQFAGVVQTRRLAINSLDWCIEPDPNADEDDAFAKEVADYVSDKLTSIDAWTSALAHLSEAIGPNLAVIELIWERAEVVDFTVVPYTRLAANPITNQGVVIRTDSEHMGLPVENFPNKFIVFVPNSKGGFPFRSTLTHASVRSYLMTWFCSADWMAFAELFGCPVRTATHDESAIPADVDVVRQEIEEGGTDVAIVLPKGWELDFKQAQGTGETYSKQLDHTDGAIAKLWLGQTLTTEIKGGGSRAAAEVHDNVRRDIRDADLKAESYCIQKQLIRPMVELKYPGQDVPVPVFKRKVYEARDVEAERLTLEQLNFAARERLTVNSDWLYDSLNIPRPAMELPEVIQLGQAAQLTEGTAADDATEGGDDGEA